jgi:hypothetical protein
MHDGGTNNLTACAPFSAKRPWSTNMPNPVHDLDDDDGNWRCEEAEVTADNTNFPTAGYSYYFRQQFTRWACTSPCYGWQSDSSAGYILHLGQMSFWALEWQADDSTNPVYGQFNYPSKTAPAGASAVVADEGSTEGSGEAFVIDVLGAATHVDTRGLETDAVVTCPQGEALRGYLRAAESRAKQAFDAGVNQDGLIAISQDDPSVVDQVIRKIGADDVVEIITVGVLPDGGTLTSGGWFPSAADAVAYATEQGASSVAIVSIRASIASHRECSALAAIDGIEMVDMTPALVARQVRTAADGDTIDVVMPILYWAQRGQ